MTDKRARMKGRRGSSSPTFTLLPHALQFCANWKQASKPCRALVADLASQFNGYNNGALCGSRTALKRQGWNSPGPLRELLVEACHYGFIVQTHQGGLGLGPSLYAIGWKPVNARADRKTGASRFDDPSLVGVTPGRWQVTREKYQKPKRKAAKTKRQNALRTGAGTQCVQRQAATGTHVRTVNDTF